MKRTVDFVQVTSQLKLLTTAIFSRILLHRRLDLLQWFGLVLLIIGIAMVEYEKITSKKATEFNDPIRGFIAVVIICKFRFIYNTSSSRDSPLLF